MKSPRGPLKSGIVTLLVVMSSFALFPRSNRVSLRVFIWASKCAVKRRHRNTISMCRAVAKGEARCKVSLHTKIFTYMCVKLHRHQWTISLKCTWLAMLRTHPKIVGVKGRKGEGFCTRSDVPTRSAALSPSAHVTHDRVCAAMLAVVTKPSLCVMRPVTQMHARKAMRTRTHQHAHKTPNAHFSFFFFFAEAMCWDGDRGLAVGRQTADAVLWHQTFQFRISLSCLLTLSLSRARAHTPVPANTTTLISSDLTAKTERLWRSNTAGRARTHQRIPKHWKVNTISSAIVETRSVRCANTFPVWFQIFLSTFKTPVKLHDLSCKQITHVRACNSHTWRVRPTLRWSVRPCLQAGSLHDVLIIKHHVGMWLCLKP